MTDEKDQTQNPPAGGSGAVPTPPVPPAQGDDAAKSAKPVKPKGPPGTGTLKKRDKHIFEIPAHPNTQFEDEDFLNLLEGSISLTMEEKKRVIEAIPRLKQEQIDELYNIFREEKEKFSQLESEFAGDVQRLKQEREKEMEMTEIKQEEAVEEEDSAAEAEEIKRQMGL